MMLTLVRRTLTRAATLFVVIGTLLVLFQLTIVAMATTIADGNGFEPLARLVPAFLGSFLGETLMSFAGMTSIGFFEPLIVMMVVQFAIYLGTEPAGDVETGLVDLVLARPLSRHQLVTRSLIVMTGAATLLPGAMSVSLWIALRWLAPPELVWPQSHRVVLLASHLAAVGWCFGAAALATSGWARRRGSAFAFVGVGAVGFYLLDFVASAWSRLEWARPLSPFHYFRGAEVLAGRTDPARDLSVLVAAGFVAVAVAYWQFQRRDV